MLTATKRRSIWSGIGALAIVVTFISFGFQLYDHFDNEPADPLELGDAGTTGSFGVTPAETSCDATVSDVPEKARQDLFEPEIVDQMSDPSNQICTATVRVRNSSDTQLPGAVIGTLLVRKAQYGSVGWYEAPALLSPDQSRNVTLVFLLPKGETPTGIELLAAVFLDPNDEPEPVEFTLS